jgi:archaellum component FlaC
MIRTLEQKLKDEIETVKKEKGEIKRENEALKARVEEMDRRASEHTNSINLLKTLLDESKEQVSKLKARESVEGASD